MYYLNSETSKFWKFWSALRCKTIYGNWKPFKNDEKYFHFTLKALFVLKIFKFLPWFFGYVLKRLD